METCFNYCGDKGFFSSDERKFVNKVRKLKEQYPDKVRIIAEPEDNDGCIYAELPREWLRIAPPVKRVLTDEQKQKCAERLKGVNRFAPKHGKQSQNSSHLPMSDSSDG